MICNYLNGLQYIFELASQKLAKNIITKEDVKKLTITKSLQDILKTGNIKFDEKTLKYLIEEEKKLLKIDIENSSNIKCDNLNYLILLNNSDCFDNFKYMVAKLMTDNIQEKITNGSTYLIDRVFEITKNLATTEEDPKTIVNYLECDNIFPNLKSPDRNYNKTKKNKLKDIILLTFNII